jgi:hypothetical protein
MLARYGTATAQYLSQQRSGVSGVVSMGRRNTHAKSYLWVFASFANVDSRKTLPCLGLVEYSPKDQVLLKNTIGPTG